MPQLAPDLDARALMRRSIGLGTIALKAVYRLIHIAVGRAAGCPNVNCEGNWVATGQIGGQQR